MKHVERLDVNVPQVVPKPIEMYSCLQHYEKAFYKEQQPFDSEEYDRIVYLGGYFTDEYPHLFACYGPEGVFHLWCGKLNDGVY